MVSVFSETAVVLYKWSHYNKESEGGIRFDDPTLAIDWEMDLKNASIWKDQICQILLIKVFQF
jgi:dTDP-4-dehydrorhamnose 3,5-epimerase